MKNHISKNTFKTYIGYLFIFYFIPQIFIFFDPSIISSFKVSNIENGFIIFLFPSIILVLDLLIPKLNSIKIYKTSFFSGKKVMIFALVFLLLSIYYYIKYDLTFRHKGAGMSSDYLLIILNFLNLYFNCLIIYKFVRLHQNKTSEANEHIIYIIIIIGNILTLNSSLQALYIGGYFFLLFPKLFFLKGLKIIYFLFFILISLLGIIYIGIANKVGYEVAQELVFSSTYRIDRIVIQRISTMHISFLYYLSHLDIEQNFSILWQEFMYTFDNLKILLGYEKGLRSDPWSINRLNFLNISKYYNIDAGASPGFFGSVVMMFPVSILLLFYKVCVLRLISECRIKMNIIGRFLFMMLTIYPVFMTPNSLVNPLSLYFIYVLLILTALHESKERFT